MGTISKWEDLKNSSKECFPKKDDGSKKDTCHLRIDRSGHTYPRPSQASQEPKSSVEVEDPARKTPLRLQALLEQPVRPRSLSRRSLHCRIRQERYISSLSQVQWSQGKRYSRIVDQWTRKSRLFVGYPKTFWALLKHRALKECRPRGIFRTLALCFQDIAREWKNHLKTSQTSLRRDQTEYLLAVPISTAVYKRYEG